jgi:hypothetical protein
MTRKEIIANAKYIQFPYINKIYKEHYGDVSPVQVPLADGYNPLYSDSVNDKHHYTTEYHRKIVLPLLESMYGFGYDKKDFRIEPLVCEDGDYSYLVPKKKMKFDIYRYDINPVSVDYDISYTDLMSKERLSGKDNHRYWGLYKYAHACSRIVNRNLPESGRTLFISGDSQILPDIPVLACYFREVWYFDNRTGYYTTPRDEYGNYSIKWNADKHIECRNRYKDKKFTDVLIQVYCAGLERYHKWNMY